MRRAEEFFSYCYFPRKSETWSQTSRKMSLSPRILTQYFWRGYSFLFTLSLSCWSGNSVRLQCFLEIFPWISMNRIQGSVFCMVCILKASKLSFNNNNTTGINYTEFIIEGFNVIFPYVLSNILTLWNVLVIAVFIDNAKCFFNS